MNQMSSSQSLNNSQISQISDRKICKIHEKLKKRDIFIATFNYGKQKYSNKRFYCGQCLEEENKEFQPKISVGNIEEYEQVDVHMDEPSLEAKLPLNQEIKNACIEQLKKFEENENVQKQKIEDYINTFQQEINNALENMEEKAQGYYKRLTTSAQELDLTYQTIVDCSKIKSIIRDFNDTEDLNIKIGEFILSKLKTDFNNKQIVLKCNDYKKVHQLYTTEAFNELRNVIIELANKISFDSQIQKNNSLSSVEANTSKAIKCLNIGGSAANSQPATLFQNLKGSTGYAITQFEDGSESLVSSNVDEDNYAKLTIAIDPNSFAQFVFEVKSSSLEPNHYVKIGIAQSDNEIQALQHYKRFGMKSTSSEEGGCSFVSFGEDLSVIQQDVPLSFSMTVYAKKNKFFFTDRQRMSKNVMSINQKLNPDGIYYVYIASKGQFTISLVHKQQESC